MIHAAPQDKTMTINTANLQLLSELIQHLLNAFIPLSV